MIKGKNMVISSKGNYLLELINEDGKSQYYTSTTRADGEGWILDFTSGHIILNNEEYHIKNSVIIKGYKLDIMRGYYAKNGKLYKTTIKGKINDRQREC